MCAKHPVTENLNHALGFREAGLTQLRKNATRGRMWVTGQSPVTLLLGMGLPFSGCYTNGLSIREQSGPSRGRLPLRRHDRGVPPSQGPASQEASSRLRASSRFKRSIPLRFRRMARTAFRQARSGSPCKPKEKRHGNEDTGGYAEPADRCRGHFSLGRESGKCRACRRSGDAAEADVTVTVLRCVGITVAEGHGEIGRSLVVYIVTAARRSLTGGVDILASVVRPIRV